MDWSYLLPPPGIRGFRLDYTPEVGEPPPGTILPPDAERLTIQNTIPGANYVVELWTIDSNGNVTLFYNETAKGSLLVPTAYFTQRNNVVRLSTVPYQFRKHLTTPPPAPPPASSEFVPKTAPPPQAPSEFVPRTLPPAPPAPSASSDPYQFRKIPTTSTPPPSEFVPYHFVDENEEKEENFVETDENSVLTEEKLRTTTSSTTFIRTTARPMTAFGTGPKLTRPSVNPTFSANPVYPVSVINPVNAQGVDISTPLNVKFEPEGKMLRISWNPPQQFNCVDFRVNYTITSLRVPKSYQEDVLGDTFLLMKFYDGHAIQVSYMYGVFDRLWTRLT